MLGCKCDMSQTGTHTPRHALGCYRSIHHSDDDLHTTHIQYTTCWDAAGSAGVKGFSE